MRLADAIVYVVDDDLSVREALRSLIRSVGLRCETFASAAEFLARPHADGAACLVLDVHLPEHSGLDLQAELARTGNAIPVVFITGQGTIPMTVRAMKAGAVEFLSKPFGERDLLQAIEQALDRARQRDAQDAERAALGARFRTLTPRERDVLSLVVAGRMNKEIAADLGATESTIKRHRGRVMLKLGVRSVADLVRLAERHGDVAAATTRTGT